MDKATRFKSMVAFSLVLSFVLTFFYTSIVVGQVEPPLGINEKLIDISEEEKQILQSLFTLTQEIEIMEREEKVINQELEMANQEIIRLESVIAGEEANYEKNQEALERVFKIYQKMGPGSYLEIIMDSDNLSTLLKRLNIMRDLTRNTGKLLEMLEVSKDKLSSEKTQVAEKLALIKERQRQSKEALAKKLKLKEDKDAYLASLNAESKLYQEYLANMQKMLSELKVLLSEAAKAFSGIIADGSLPRDAIKITISLFNVKGKIDEETFNNILAKQASLSEMEFAFNNDEIKISIPKKQLVLSGDFVIQGDNILSLKKEAFMECLLNLDT